jgi:hypothetical protein
MFTIIRTSKLKDIEARLYKLEEVAGSVAMKNVWWNINNLSRSIINIKKETMLMSINSATIIHTLYCLRNKYRLPNSLSHPISEEIIKEANTHLAKHSIYPTDEEINRAYDIVNQHIS